METTSRLVVALGQGWEVGEGIGKGYRVSF